MDLHLQIVRAICPMQKLPEMAANLTDNSEAGKLYGEIYNKQYKCRFEKIYFETTMY